VSDRRRVVVNLWTGVLPLGPLLGPEDPDPTVEQLDAIERAWTAENEGVRPRARVARRPQSPRTRRWPAAGASHHTHHGQQRTVTHQKHHAHRTANHSNTLADESRLGGVNAKALST
jgi:hypothetical protein